MLRAIIERAISKLKYERNHLESRDDDDELAISRNRSVRQPWAAPRSSVVKGKALAYRS
jgi:hypothetical protein